MSNFGKAAPMPQKRNKESKFLLEKPKRAMPTKTILVRLLKYFGRSRYILYGIFGLIIISTLLNAAKPYLTGKIIDELTKLYDGDTSIYVSFYTYIVFLVIATTSASLIQYFQGYLAGHLNKELIYNLRRDVFNKLVALPLSYTESKSHGDLMSRVVNDTENVSNVLCQSIGSFFGAIVSVVSITTIMLMISPLLTLIVYLFVPLSIVLTKFLSRRMRRYFKAKHETLGKLEGNIEESTYGYETLLAFNQRERMSEKFEAINENYRQISIKAGILSNFVNPLLMVLSGVSYIAVVFIGAIMVINGRITIGTIQTFLLYIRQITQPLNNITSLYAQIQTALASAERFFEIYDAVPEEDYGTVQVGRVQGEIEINDVHFSYFTAERKAEDFDKRVFNKEQNIEKSSPKTVLKDFNLHIKAGQKIAIVGETGSGKTSIINMIMRFYPFQSGTIKLDNTNLENYTLESLRKNIALVPQDTFFFSGTIRDNILYTQDTSTCNDESTEQRIIDAAKCANAHDFIMQLPEQYDTILSSEAGNLSAGQKQLLALTRAFMKDAPILILDEATANIDTLTEMQIQKAILSLMENRTCLVIAHRLSTVVNMDKIIVLDKGKIVESGNHEELLACKGHYFNLYSTN